VRILFTARHYLPAIGGLQQSVHQLAELVLARGHEVAVLTLAADARTLSMRAARVARKLGYPALPTDKHLGYPVYRAIDAHDGTRNAENRFRPDVVVVNAGGERTLRFGNTVLDVARAPKVLYVRDSASYVLLDRRPPPDLVITNAAYHTDVAREHGIDAITIPSVVRTEDYLTATTRRAVLYVNPHPLKGVDLAWRVAEAAPEIPFVFLEAWPLPPDQRDGYATRARALGNVELRPATTDPHAIYSDARVLLVPYVDQNRPRVVAEAQANGIPVVGLDCGGVAEAVGPGGTVLPETAPPAAWAAELRRLWGDAGAYDALVDAARLHSTREEMRPVWLAGRFLGAIEQVVEGHTRTAGDGR
jgi:glycosyltransferase involved in cell wall biosynthesis